MIIPVLLIALLPASRAASPEFLLLRFQLHHPDILNPAVTGSYYLPQACISYQKMWAGFPGSPQSMMASGSFRIGHFDFYTPRQMINTTHLRSRERIGLGASLTSDRNGPLSFMGGQAAYAYHLPLENARLSFGLGTGFGQWVLNGSMLNPTDPADPLLAGERERFFSANAHAGAYYYSRDLFGGVAVRDLIPLENPLDPGNRIRPDAILHGGYLFSSFGRPSLELGMTVCFPDLNDVAYEAWVRTFIREVHWLALSLRSSREASVHAGFRIAPFTLAYSFETNLSPLARYHAGTHAVHLGINLGMRRISGF